MPTSESTTVQDKPQRQWDAVEDADADRAHELYAEDAVLEFPQSKTIRFAPST